MEPRTNTDTEQKVFPTTHGKTVLQHIWTDSRSNKRKCSFAAVFLNLTKRGSLPQRNL